jgi:hypothetical protein
MTYLKVRWIHKSPDDPVLLYSELDDKRREIRKVEIVPDHSIGFASANSKAKDTRLGEVPVPTIEEIAANPEFEPKEISLADFELIWRNRFRTDLPN